MLYHSMTDDASIKFYSKAESMEWIDDGHAQLTQTTFEST